MRQDVESCRLLLPVFLSVCFCKRLHLRQHLVYTGFGNKHLFNNALDGQTDFPSQGSRFEKPGIHTIQMNPYFIQFQLCTYGLLNGLG